MSVAAVSPAEQGLCAWRWVLVSGMSPSGNTYLFIFNLLCFFTFIFERQSTSGGGAGREGGAESEAGSRLRAVSTEPDVGLELTDREIMT